MLLKCWNKALYYTALKPLKAIKPDQGEAEIGLDPACDAWLKAKGSVT